MRSPPPCSPNAELVHEKLELGKPEARQKDRAWKSLEEPGTARVLRKSDKLTKCSLHERDFFLLRQHFVLALEHWPGQGRHSGNGGGCRGQGFARGALASFRASRSALLLSGGLLETEFFLQPRLERKHVGNRGGSATGLATLGPGGPEAMALRLCSMSIKGIRATCRRVSQRIPW